ncbi:MAG: hypothetical protein WC552_07370 [Candidatus Omnitrophota bacterium]
MGFFKKIPLKVAHLPTVVLMVGYAMFWVELYILRAPFGKTSFSAWGLLGAATIGVLMGRWPGLRRLLAEAKKWWDAQNRFKRSFVSLVGLLSLTILFVGLMASLLPPHLSQEYDSLNYHITVPRQHLIGGFFAHLTWSVADLFPLPLDFAMAPYSLITPWPNKVAFSFFILGILGVAGQLAWRISGKNVWAGIAVLMAVLGAHGLSIQIGVAMFDLIMLYLFLAALDSFLTGNWLLASIEFSFYFWSKSFIPIQVCVLGIILWIIFLIAKKGKWQICSVWQPAKKMKIKKAAWGFVISSLLIGGPFVVKSLYYTGTPIYPFYPGVLSSGSYRNTEMWPSVVERGNQLMDTRNQYGRGRGLKQFVEHFWVLAVPEEGVNNRFDYPLGLSYLLVLAPFGFLFLENLRNRRVDLAAWFCVLFWASWWFGSQQSRFLYVPLLMMSIIVLSDERFLRKSMFFALLVSLSFSCLSVVRAHQSDIFRKPAEVLRDKDRKLIERSASVNRASLVRIDFEDAAFADFAVDVVRPGSVFVFEQQE